MQELPDFSTFHIIFRGLTNLIKRQQAMIIARFTTILLLLSAALPALAQDEVYEWRTYELEFGRSADLLHNYFKDALIPALNRQGIEHVGVFEEAGERLPQKIHLLIPYDNLMAMQESLDELEDDQAYLNAAAPYIAASEEEIPFKRITSNLIRSTAGFPELVNRENASLYELRIYESRHEDALSRKVKMFNDSEFDIFEDVGLPLVFFGENIAGEQMPCLTYLLAFEDREARDEAWSKFGPHPEWQRIIQLEEYANAMNDITRVFLTPLDYSQL